MVNSIDIIIPSFRAQKEYILPILNLLQPTNILVKFYLVIDNPELHVDEEILSKIDDDTFHLVINPKNLGASATRNKGIESGAGNWILFLDDDIKVDPNLLKVYANAIEQNQDEIGFIGLVTLPPVETPFTRAILASGSAGIFNIAETSSHFAWGATANMIINRQALGEVRFSNAYPKSGGGEDVDFFLRMRKANHYKDFKTLKEAQVWHPWWDNGNPNYKRAFRYGEGTGYLIKLNPEYTRYDYPSTPETFLFSLVLLIVSIVLSPSFAIKMLLFIPGIVIIDIIASYINARRKENITLQVLAYMIIMKFSYDLGVLTTNLSKGYLNDLLKRFNYNGEIKKDHFLRMNRYKIVKLILTVILITCIIIFS